MMKNFYRIALMVTLGLELACRFSSADVLPIPERWYSQAAGCCQQTYCPAQNSIGMQVGDSILLYTIGDGSNVQRTNIYDSKSLGLVVAYQGTNVSSQASMSNNDKFFLTLPDKHLGLPKGSLIEEGAQDAWRKSWSILEREVDRMQTSHHSISVVGHSLGAQLAIIASIALHKKYGSKVRVITFGQPRVGNAKFADYVDKIFGLNTSKARLSYVINGADYTSNLPPRFLGYQQFSGQVWINPPNTTNYHVLQGQENPHGSDSVLLPPQNLYNHQGIYMHTRVGDIIACPAKVGEA